MDRKGTGAWAWPSSWEQGQEVGGQSPGRRRPRVPAGRCQAQAGHLLPGLCGVARPPTMAWRCGAWSASTRARLSRTVFSVCCWFPKFTAFLRPESCGPDVLLDSRRCPCRCSGRGRRGSVAPGAGHARPISGCSSPSLPGQFGQQQLCSSCWISVPLELPAPRRIRQGHPARRSQQEARW